MVIKKFLKNNGRYLKNNGKYLGNSNLGYGLSFDGFNDYIQLPQTIFQNNLQPNLDFSFSIWINVGVYWNTNFTQGAIFSSLNNSNYDNTTKGFVIGSFGNGTITMSLLNQPNSLSEQSIIQMQNQNLTGIHHFVFTYKSGAGLKVYLDSVEQVPSFDFFNPAMTTIDYSSNFHSIGGYVAGSFFYKDVIYDLKVFNKEITQTEIQELYYFNRIFASTQPNCIFDMRFDRINKFSPNVYIPERISGLDAYSQMIGYPTGSVGLVDIKGNVAVLTP